MDNEEQEISGNSHLDGAIGAADGFIAEINALLGLDVSLLDLQANHQHEIENRDRRIGYLENEVEMHKGFARDCRKRLHDCESRDCIEDDPDSVENMRHYNDARDSSGYL